MDYRQKMVLASQQKFHTDDDDDEDLEALRLAALQSLRTKDTLHNKRQSLTQLQKVVPQVTQIARPSYKPQRLPRRAHFHNRLQQRQNGNLYYQSPRNPNLIAIVPVDEHSELQNIEITTATNVEKTDTHHAGIKVAEESKFHRYKDTGSGSDEDDSKNHTNNLLQLKGESVKTGSIENEDTTKKKETQSEVIDDSQKHEDEEDVNDDDDDILLMADLEEEDSLERLMDEMEREMNVDKLIEKKDKEISRKNNKQCDENVIQETKKNEENVNRKENNNHATSLTINVRCERRSVSPHITSGVSQKRRSLSPKSRSSRKRSPRRSPRRSPLRQIKKSQREINKYKSPVRRSPHRKLSPRIRSPRSSPHSRSPKLLRSRSPRILSRSRSPPRTIRSPKITSRSPRLTRSRSPIKLSSQSRSRSKSTSPRRLSPSKRISPRSRSPGFSPRRGSPRRMSPPKISPRRSPWSSPRNSPRLSPRRRRSPKVSPKELTRKHGGTCSVSPDNTLNSLYIRESPPMHKRRLSPESYREKTKQKEENSDKIDLSDVKDTIDNTVNDPILEARRKKFESTRPIDPLLANKKIKLSNANKKTEVLDRTQTISTKKINKLTDDDHNVRDRDICLDTTYEFEELGDTMENNSPLPISSSINSCINVESSKTEKEKSSKKKKKRDKEIYQVGKLKSELPLSERIGKDKKCKKRKDIITEVQNEDVDAIFEDIAVDEEGDLRAELSRRRAERLNRSVPIQSARLVQSAFKGVVNEVVKNNAKVNQRHVIKNDEKVNQKDVRRVTVVRSVSELHDSGDESNLDSKVPVRLRLGLNKQIQDTRETKSRKTSKRQNRKVKHKTNLTLTNPENVL
ncbi:serine/arginine repetitive matrix protein 1-like isoform X1 [Vespa mandarinia]|uniref:serine/arginine repetitive matrix protein 1-like isoform X1 n=1 Tax=Vespa mandarinia TaxID=7446 RepID=UPI00160F2C1F|nr:serine/arginine repetitive matrix protein 1-like isoform X1 [Vespa mandarinia]